MNNWSLDKLVVVGLVTSLMLTILAVDIIAVMQGDISISGLGKEIIVGLFGYMSRVYVQSVDHGQDKPPQSQTSQTLEQIAGTATEAQKVVDAFESIKDIVKNERND